ncbi:hypothetical protein C8R46DRAFT_1086871 [Mycena filopes]|nr:hypothetical protein C8R46DRAFT_1086871 [Mycena filopes]
MPMSHPRRVPRPLSPHSGSLFLHALSIHRPRHNRVREQSRFIRVYMAKKQHSLHPRRQINAQIHALRYSKAASLSPASNSPSPAVSATSCVPSISARRSASIDNRPSSTTHRDSPLILSIKSPLPNLSKFSSPFTPANRVLDTPFHPPASHKGTPSKRDRNRHWQWSPALCPRLRSPRVDENTSPMRTPADDSPICNLTRRFSLIAPPSSPKHVPRRLSYSHACASPYTPETRPGQALASPVLIRSSLWAPSPVTSPRYQLDELHFSPFHVASF